MVKIFWILIVCNLHFLRVFLWISRCGISQAIEINPLGNIVFMKLVKTSMKMTLEILTRWLDFLGLWTNNNSKDVCSLWLSLMHTTQVCLSRLGYPFQRGYPSRQGYAEHYKEEENALNFNWRQLVGHISWDIQS